MTSPPLDRSEGSVPPAAPARLEAEPEYAAELFGERIGSARRFAADLAEQGELRGLIGPLENARLWSRHLINCVLLAPLLRPGRVGDVGSGAGLPGLVLAIARPDVEFVLIEPMERRVDWLLEESARLGLDNVEVVRARAEDAQLESPLDQLTARAVKAFDKLIPVTVPLLRPGGELILMKGRSAQDEIDKAAKQIRRFGLEEVRVQTLGERWGTDPTWVIRASLSHRMTQTKV